MISMWTIEKHTDKHQVSERLPLDNGLKLDVRQPNNQKKKNFEYFLRTPNLPWPFLESNFMESVIEQELKEIKNNI